MTSPVRSGQYLRDNSFFLAHSSVLCCVGELKAVLLLMSLLFRRGDKPATAVSRAEGFVSPRSFTAADLSTFASSTPNAALSSTAQVLRDTTAPSYGQLQSQLYGGPRVLSRINEFGEVDRERARSPGLQPARSVSSRQHDFDASRPY